MKNRNAVSRRGFLRATAQGGAAVWLANKGLSRAAESEANSPKRPNILFIMVDEMRWDAMGCAGHPVVRTPNLDRLARQGVLFANSYSVAPVCCPARRTLFTGRYAHVH